MTEVLASLGRWPLGPAIRFDLHGDRLVVHAFEEASSSDEEEADESDVIPTAEVVTPSAPAA
jgi:extradiol dioxygenase family protein